MTIRTAAPKTYIPPSASDIKQMAKEVGVARYNTSLVQDLCNIQAGGDFVPSSQLEKELIKNITRINGELKLASDGDYKFRGEWLRDENGHCVSDLDDAQTIVAKQQVKYHKKIQDFVRTLDFSNVPGHSPLEKSLGLLKILSSQEGGSPEDIEDDECGNALPIFSENNRDKKDPEEMARRINEVLENVSDMDEHEKILCNITGDGSNSPLALAADMLDGKDIMLKIKRDLDKLCALQTTKHCVMRADSNGAEIRYRPMQDISEIARLHPTEFIYPEAYRNYRWMNSVAQVRERCSKIDKKMLLYIICDCSGSMGGDKFLKAGGVVMNRLKAVLRGEADLWLAFFHNRLGEEFKASSENIPEVRKLMSHIKASNFDQGGTSIARCTKEAIARIEKKRKQDPKLVAPELLVITDGDDNTSSLTVGHLHGIRLNTVIVGGHNQHLINVSRQSGGVGISRI